MKNMKNMNKLSLLLIMAGAFVITTSSFTKAKTIKTVKTNASAFVIPQDDQASAKYPNGARIYQEKCFACHQVTGLGIPGAFPPLKGSDYLLADKKRAVQQVLNGSNHEITVNGAKYAIPMPPQVDNYQDAVDVINYVLNAWGNKGGTISVDEVKDIKIIR
ncbi:MAG TPA: c-type cytochrome [Bacteroidetes bacterium]|nr:c-type cytochrome [Bacteroidota bacterium]